MLTAKEAGLAPKTGLELVVEKELSVAGTEPKPVITSTKIAQPLENSCVDKI